MSNFFSPEKNTEFTIEAYNLMNSYAQGGETYDAAQIIIHENYNSVSNGSDIALIRLEDPIVYNDLVYIELV